MNCSYCLSRVSCSFVECKRCHRRIHKECLGINCCDFSLCFDCWMPKLLENEYNNVDRIRSERKKREKEGRDYGEKDGGETTNSSGVSEEKGKEKGKGKAVAKKKFTWDRTMVGKKPIVLAITNTPLSWISVKKDEEGDRRCLAVDDDARLAFRLHRAMNSSPRITRNSCSLNTHCVDVPEFDGDVNGVGTSCNTKIRENGSDEGNGLLEVRQDCVQKYARIRGEKCNKGSGGNLITYCRKRRALLRAKDEPECSTRRDNGGLLSGNLRAKEEKDRALRTYRRRLSEVKKRNGGLSSGNLTVKEERDRALRTYRRRISEIKKRKLEFDDGFKTYSRRRVACPNDKSKMIYGFNLEDGTLAPTSALDRYEESRTLTATS